MQHHVLERYPRARLHVYAVWTDKRLRDSRSAWDAAELTDARVSHLWDARDVSGAWIVEHASGFQGDDWDTYALFGADARWTASSVSPLVSSGSTVIGSADRLLSALSTVLTGSQP